MIQSIIAGNNKMGDLLDRNDPALTGLSFPYSVAVLPDGKAQVEVFLNPAKPAAQPAPAKPAPVSPAAPPAGTVAS